MILERTTKAKLNLTLSVTGRRNDGYHLLHSLVAFAEIGDRLRAEAGEGVTLSITGRERGDLSAEENLVMQAARKLRPAGARGLALHLEKNLPVASGIGGGSGDAAAALELADEWWKLGLSPEAKKLIALSLGADVPVCLLSQACLMEGIGEAITPLDAFPELHAVLVNPRMTCPTPSVFRTYGESGRSFTLQPNSPAGFESKDVLFAYLDRYGNDLETAATHLLPVIEEALAALRDMKDAEFVRMSGSGATVFALFEKEDAAMNARDELRSRYSEWWIERARLS